MNVKRDVYAGKFVVELMPTPNINAKSVRVMSILSGPAKGATGDEYTRKYRLDSLSIHQRYLGSN
jgi:hypothetical protein